MGSTTADGESTTAEDESTAAEETPTTADAEPAKETPEPSQKGMTRAYLETQWESHHERPPTETETGVLSKFIIESAVSGKGFAHMFGEGGRLARQGLPIQDDPDGVTHDQDSAVRSMRRGSLPAPLDLEARMYACMDMDAALPSPADEPTRRFAAGLTALSADGKTLGQDFDDASRSPTFPVPRPGAGGAAPSDSPVPSAAADEYSESESASTLLAPLVYVAETRELSTGPSMSLSPPGGLSSDGRNGEVSGDPRVEEPPRERD